MSETTFCRFCPVWFRLLLLDFMKVKEIASQSRIAAYGLELRQMLKLAWPIVLAQLAHMSLGLTDSLMVGRINPESLASIGVGGSLFFVTFIVFGGIMMSVSAIVAQSEGSGDTQTGFLSLCQAMLLATVISIPLIILFHNGTFMLERVLRQESIVVQLGADYLRAMSWGILPSLWLMALRSYFEAIARPWPLLFVTLLGFVANIGFNLLFIFGYGPFPAMGLTGAGWASTSVYFLMFIAAVVYLNVTLGHQKPFAQLRKIDTSMMSEIIRIGLPIGVALGFESAFFALTTFLMGQFGTDALAAHEVAIRTASFTFMIPLGLTAATTVRVGQAAGRDDKAGVRRAGITGIYLSIFAMSLSALAYLTIPRTIIGFYIDLNDPANSLVIQQAIAFFALAGMFQIFDGLQVSSLGALRGLKDTRMPMIITAIAYWILGFGSLYIFTFKMGMNGNGLWLGLVVALAAAGGMLCWRFLRLSKAEESSI